MVSDNQFGLLQTVTMCENIVKKKLKIRIPLKNKQTLPVESSEFRQHVVHYSDVSKIASADSLNMKLRTCASNKRGPPDITDSHTVKRLKMDRSVKQQCSSILKTLMTHPAGWVFNKPVDPVALNIPDYFSIVTEPMDLGTIKAKLEEYLYFTVEDFTADVRLTFSNAMLYNPASNNVHAMAKELDDLFTSRWTSMLGKVSCGSRNLEHVRINNSQQTNQPAHKSPIHMPKFSLSLEEKKKLRKDLVQASSQNMTEKLHSFLHKFGLICSKEEMLEMKLDSLNGETISELKRLLKVCLDARDAKANNVKIAEDRKRELPRKIVHKVTRDKSSCGLGDAKQSLSLVDHAFMSPSEKSVGQGQRAYKKGCEKKNMQIPCVRKADKDYHSSLDKEIICSTTTPPHCVSAVSEEGSSAVIDIQLSPKKALRAAMLKRRFAETIFKAKQKTLLDNAKKADLVKIQLEKERLERQQQEEKARMDTQIKAAEAAARHRAEEEKKKQREREREAARIALQQMEKTVEIYDNLAILKDLEMLRGSVYDRTGRGCFQNPLERLGLFMKAEFLGDEADYAEGHF